MKIKNYKKLRNGQYEVSFENGDKVLLYEDAILDAELLRKKEITIEELNKIVSLNEKYEVYIKSIKYLNTKMRSEKEIRTKFKNYSKEALDYAINRLEKEGYLNNQSYIAAYVNDQINLKVVGPNKIKKDLSSLGFKEEEFQEVIDNIDNEVWLVKIRKLIDKTIKSNHNKSNSSLVIKITNDLMNKGFPAYLIADELNKIEFNDDSLLLEKEFNKLYKKYKEKYSKEELKYQLTNKLYQKGFEKDKINRVISKIM
ncbi:MAG: RecX family transcriptional regulator [Bacilli bacterium]|nr:RecX family transcriptional regulator [Bacilli bacterium]